MEWRLRSRTAACSGVRSSEMEVSYGPTSPHIPNVIYHQLFTGVGVLRSV